MSQQKLDALIDEHRASLRGKAESPIHSEMVCSPRLIHPGSQTTVLVRIFGSQSILARLEPLLELVGSEAFGRRPLTQHVQGAESADYYATIRGSDLPVGKVSRLQLRPSPSEDPIAATKVTVYEERALARATELMAGIVPRVEPREDRPKHWWQRVLEEFDPGRRPDRPV